VGGPWAGESITFTELEDGTYFPERLSIGNGRGLEAGWRCSG
jgi:hypothetical protein